MRTPLLSALLLPFALAACNQPRGLQDLQGFVAEVKSSNTYAVTDIPPYAPDVIVVYTSHRRDPFAALASSPSTGIGSQPARPDHADCVNPRNFRHAQTLEQYPLDSLRIVGLLAEKQGQYALIKDPDDLVHKVQVGDYMGQNNGRVVALTQAGVDLLEMLDTRDNGCYEERQARLVLRDGGQAEAKLVTSPLRKPVF